MLDQQQMIFLTHPDEMACQPLTRELWTFYPTLCARRGGGEGGSDSKQVRWVLKLSQFIWH